MREAVTPGERFIRERDKVLLSLALPRRDKAELVLRIKRISRP